MAEARPILLEFSKSHPLKLKKVETSINKLNGKELVSYVKEATEGNGFSQRQALLMLMERDYDIEKARGFMTTNESDPEEGIVDGDLASYLRALEKFYKGKLQEILETEGPAACPLPEKCEGPKIPKAEAAIKKLDGKKLINYVKKARDKKLSVTQAFIILVESRFDTECARKRLKEKPGEYDIHKYPTLSASLDMLEKFYERKREEIGEVTTSESESEFGGVTTSESESEIE